MPRGKLHVGKEKRGARGVRCTFSVSRTSKTLFFWSGPVLQYICSFQDRLLSLSNCHSTPGNSSKGTVIRKLLLFGVREVARCKIVAEVSAATDPPLLVGELLVQAPELCFTCSGTARFLPGFSLKYISSTRQV